MRETTKHCPVKKILQNLYLVISTKHIAGFCNGKNNTGSINCAFDALLRCPIRCLYSLHTHICATLPGSVYCMVVPRAWPRRTRKNILLRNSLSAKLGDRFCRATFRWRLGLLIFRTAAQKIRLCSTTRFRKFFAFVNSGGGGIFLAPRFLHILPKGLEFLAPVEEGDHDDYHDQAHSFPTGMSVVLFALLAFM